MNIEELTQEQKELAVWELLTDIHSTLEDDSPLALRIAAILGFEDFTEEDEANFKEAWASHQACLAQKPVIEAWLADRRKAA